MGWLGSKSNAAIDIGGRTIKGVRLKRARGRVRLESYFLHDLAKGNDLFPVRSDTEETIRALVEVNRFGKTPLISSLPDSELLSHDITLPEMPEEEIRAAIMNDIEETFQFPPEQTCYDYVVLDTIRNPDHVQRLIKTYCAKRETVTGLIELLKKAGTRPVAIDAGILARVSALAFNGYIKPDGKHALLEIGESHLTVSLVSDMKVVIHNVLPTGLGQINRVLFEAAGISYEDAERAKFAYDLQSQEEATDANHGRLDEVFYDLFYRVQRLVDFFRVHLRATALDSLLVSGGGSQLKHLDGALQNICDLPTEIVNPLRNIEIYARGTDQEGVAHAAPFLTTAVGLALRGLEE